ncbi:MAG: ferritin-like domain-containing protein [Pseudomonadota bacterium]
MDPLLAAHAAHPPVNPTIAASLEPPSLTGWPQWQASCVNRLKRAGLRELHASEAGERLLLHVYWVGEQVTEIALCHPSFTDRPVWLERQMAQHLADEQRHTQSFEDALRARGAVPATQPPRADALSRWKIWRWQRLATSFAPRFAQGAWVPAFAIGLCAEQMATRVLTRHCDAIGDQHPLYPLLSSVLADEARHVRMCQHTLTRMVQPGEQAALVALLAQVRAVDRAFGITGALGLLLAAWVLRLMRWARPQR